MNVKERVGSFFKQRREDCGRNSAEVAEAVGLSNEDLKSLEGGKEVMKIDFMEKLIKLYSIEDQTLIDFARRGNSDLLNNH